MKNLVAPLMVLCVMGSLAAPRSPRPDESASKKTHLTRFAKKSAVSPEMMPEAGTSVRGGRLLKSTVNTTRSVIVPRKPTADSGSPSGARLNAARLEASQGSVEDMPNMVRSSKTSPHVTKKYTKSPLNPTRGEHSPSMLDSVRSRLSSFVSGGSSATYDSSASSRSRSSSDGSSSATARRSSGAKSKRKHRSKSSVSTNFAGLGSLGSLSDF